MNKADPPANAFVPGMPSTVARTGAEDAIETLRKRGGVFVDAVRATRMAMVLTDPTLPGNPIVFANQAFLDLSGYDMDEVLGQQPHFMNGRRTDPADAGEFRRALEEDCDVVVETVQYRRDDTRFTATVLLSAFKDESGKTLNHFLSWTDISRRVEAEDEIAEQREMYRALRESEEKYRSLFETMGQGYCELELVRDAGGRAVDQLYLQFNPAFERVFGIPVAKARGRKASEVFPGLEPVWTESFERAVKSGRPERIEQPVGALGRWFEVCAYPGKGDRVVALFEDVTERKCAEIALRASEERLRDVLNTMRDGFALLGPDFTLLDVNEETLRLDGRPREELVGRSHWQAFPGTEHSPLGEAYKRVVRDGTQASIEHRYLWPDGREMWVDVHAYPTPQGGVAVFWRDITRRKRAEQALRDSETRAHLLLSELQHRVRNILSVIRSVFARTVETGGSIEEMADHFRGRLDALARTQIIVTQSPGGTADLENLIRDELLVVSAGDDLQLELAGPEVELSGEAAEALGLVVHELTTNSIKYGALRFSGAGLAVRWSINVDYSDRPNLVFIWEEQGVPAMPVEPGREGFGTELITRALPYRLGAKTSFELRPGGVRCLIELPLPRPAHPRGGH